MRTVDAMAGTKLHPDEQQIVRHAADALLFRDGLGADPGVREALAELQALMDRLVESDRLIYETAETLIAEVKACGQLGLAPAF